jgi:sugar (pentulose or hexulose) kinase
MKVGIIEDLNNCTYRQKQMDNTPAEIYVLCCPIIIFDVTNHCSSVDVIAIFDIGKTNKKFLLFDSMLNIVYRDEKVFAEIPDDDGSPSDDISAIESWMRSCLREQIEKGDFEIRGLNFAAYGASLVHLDVAGRRVAPLYNYMRDMPEGVLEGFYDEWGGISEFCRKTASPALGMLNSGLQLLWLKRKKPQLFSEIKSSLHLPQYLSYLFTGKKMADYTSLGCHTAMWDFDTMKYHPWLKTENIEPEAPVSHNTVLDADIEGMSLKTGIGIHDSSASLVPYLKTTDQQFILISTGTWCIFMNPFNSEPLTSEQLNNDTLCYLSINRQQVKASRLFLGHIHDMNVVRLDDHFGVTGELFKTIRIRSKKIRKLLAARQGRVFFRNGIPPGYVDNEVDLSHYLTYADAYHQMMCDLVDVCMESLRQIIPADDRAEVVYITGGFARNDSFVRILAARLPDKRVFVSNIENSTALGAAITVYESAFGTSLPPVYLGLKAIIDND